MAKGCSTCGKLSNSITASATQSFSPTSQGKRLTKSFTDINVQDGTSCGTLTVRDDDDTGGGGDDGFPWAMALLAGGVVTTGIVYTQSNGNGFSYGR